VANLDLPFAVSANVIGVLQRKPQEELQALLEMLEPLPRSTLMEREPQP
jgi:hypothetical protein